jgi:long-chain acyl-CoA synthetase
MMELYHHLKEKKTIHQYFLYWEKMQPNLPFLRVAKGNSWKEYSWKETGILARKLLGYLRKQGLKKGDHVGIISKNCPEWIIADLAIMFGGFVSVPLYTNQTPAQLEQVIVKGDIKVLFVGKLDEYKKLKEGIPDHVSKLGFNHYEGNAVIDDAVSWQEMIEGEEDEDIVHGTLEDVWTILFTSGTTGNPKGVVLKYRSPIEILNNEWHQNNIQIFQHQGHRFFSYLPLNHIAERLITELAAIACGAPISFAESINTFALNLQAVQPTVFLAVPRIWTKFQLAILSKIPKKLFAVLLNIPIVSGRLKHKIKFGLGLKEAKIVLTGAAHCPDVLKDWFLQLGLEIREVYGMTENCGGCVLMPAGVHKKGYVGEPLPQVALKVDPETEEVIMQSPWIMEGYYKEPDKTAEVLREGWLYTGDKGYLDSSGYLKITGRISDTFKTSKGKFVNPVPLEDLFLEDSLVEMACVIGNGLDQPKALVVLSDIAKDLDISDLKEKLHQKWEEINAALPSHEKVDQLIVAREIWSVDNNMLTPTMKIKRNVIEKNYEDKLPIWKKMPDKVIFE